MMVDIASFIPPAIARDLRRMVEDLRSRGAQNILIQIPNEDYATTLLAVSQHLFVPFTPVFHGCAVAGWDGDHVGVMAQAAPTEKHPTIFTADGREHPVA
jgi:hypothetical protein